MPPSLRIIRCMITFFEEKKFGAPLLHAIRLSQCLDSHMWYDSTLVCRQLEGIGAALANNLMQGNIVSFSELEAANPRKIESLLKRNPPAGNLLQANLQKIWPKLLLTIQVAIVNGTVEMIVSVQSENLSDCERHKFRGKFSRVLVLHERKKLLLFTSRTKSLFFSSLFFFFLSHLSLQEFFSTIFHFQNQLPAFRDRGGSRGYGLCIERKLWFFFLFSFLQTAKFKFIFQ